MNISNKNIIIALTVIIVIVGAIITIRSLNKPVNEMETTNQINQDQPSEDATLPDNQLNMDQNNDQATSTVNTEVKNFKNLVTLETSLGTIKFKTYDADAPKTVENYLTLAKKGFYDNLIFHRVIDKFMIQGGDPTGTGAGGPGYQFADELNPETESYKQGYVAGTVAMANAGPNTNGSQFFIMVDNVPLQHDYTIFGQVVEGQEVANAISKVKKDVNDRPEEKVIIKKVTVEEIK